MMATHKLAACLVLYPLLLTGCSQGAESEPDRLYIAPRPASDTVGLPFSGAVQIGRTLYLSGQIGLDENRQVPDTPEAEAHMVLDAIQRLLGEAGMTMDELVYVQVFCSDLAHYDVFNRAYRTYFTREFPARAFIGSGPLLFGARFEVQGIAVRR